MADEEAAYHDSFFGEPVGRRQLPHGADGRRGRGEVPGGLGIALGQVVVGVLEIREEDVDQTPEKGQGKGEFIGAGIVDYRQV